VLLVEDEPADVLLISRAFRKAGLEPPTHIGDGEAAVAYMERALAARGDEPPPVPAVTLLDLKLPRKSGLEFLQWLRAQPSGRHMPVVVLTSSREEADLRAAYDRGANSYLVKPVTADALNQMVATLGLYWLRMNQRPSSGDTE
jgi:CheY-like chemotaxis protein